MKRLFLFTILICASFLVSRAQIRTTTPQTSADVGNAPIRSGNWLVGSSIGSTGFNFTTETFQLNIEPKAGYFVDDRVAIGAGVTLGISAYKGGSSFSYGIAPFVRYYLAQSGSLSGRWFGEGNIGFAGSEIEDSQEDSPLSLLLGIRAGYAHFIARNVALEGTLGYTYSKADISASSGTSGLGLGFGFQVYLPGRRR